MSVTGRPRRLESRRRRARLLQLLADGAAPRQALAEAKVDPVRAFELACHPDFQAVLGTLRETAA